MNWMIVRIGMCPWLLMICIVPFCYCTPILTDLGVNTVPVLICCLYFSRFT